MKWIHSPCLLGHTHQHNYSHTHTHTLSLSLSVSLSLSLPHTLAHTLQSIVAVSEPAVDKIVLGCTACRQILLWPLTGNWNRVGWCGSRSTCLFVSVCVRCLFERLPSPLLSNAGQTVFLQIHCFAFNECSSHPWTEWPLVRCVNECLCPKKKSVKGEEPYCRSVCILPFGHQTGQRGDCTSWHYCILLNEGPVTDPQTHWPSSVFCPSHWVQVLCCVLLMV